jgi:hypothetical protein
MAKVGFEQVSVGHIDLSVVSNDLSSSPHASVVCSVSRFTGGFILCINTSHDIGCVVSQEEWRAVFCICWNQVNTEIKDTVAYTSSSIHGKALIPVSSSSHVVNLSWVAEFLRKEWSLWWAFEIAMILIPEGITSIMARV